MLLSTKDYTLAPLSLTAKVKFREWVRESTLAELRERLALYGDLLDPSERRRLVEGALVLIDGGQAEATLLESPEGKRMLAFLHLQPNHPEITLEQAGELVPALAIAGGFDAKVEMVNGLAEVEPEAAAPATKWPTSADKWIVDLPRTATASAPEVPPEERRVAVFDAICAKNDVSPQDLVNLPIGPVAAMYLRETGASDVDRLKLKARVCEYAAAKKATESPAPSDVPPPNVVAFVNQLNEQAGRDVAEIIKDLPKAE